MAQTFRLEDMLQALAAAPSLKEMEALLNTIRDEYGLANMVYHTPKLPNVPTANPVLLLTYEPNWVKEYIGNNYFDIDPIVEHGNSRDLPLDWATIDKRDAGVAHFFREAERSGVGRQGVTIPIRGPMGERALFTVTSHASDREWASKRAELIRDYFALAHYFHDRTMFLHGARKNRPILSRRETECIRLLADGVQPKAIAYRMGVSTDAVKQFTAIAKHKLRGATLAQTIALAVRHEHI